MILAAVFQYSTTAIASGLCALLPMVLHWFFRRRHLIQEWPSLVVLKRVVAERKQQMVWKQILLLMMRAIGILCLGYAISRPTLSSSWFWWAIFPCSVAALLGCAVLVTCDGRQRLAGLAILIVCGGMSLLFSNFAPASGNASGDVPENSIVLIDNSMSMSMRTAAGSRFDAAKKRAIQIIEGAPVGSRFSVLTTDSADRWMERVSLSAQRAKNHIEKMEISAYASDLGSLQQPLLELIDRLPSEPVPRLYIISDMQRVQWNGFGTEQASELPIASVYDAGSELISDNVTVKSLNVVDPVLSSDIETAVLVELGYVGKQPTRTVDVRLFVNDKLQSTQRVQLQSGANADIRFQLSLSMDLAAGASWVPIRVEVPADALAGDNLRHLVVPVMRSIPVVFIDELGASGQRATEFSRGESSPLIDLIAPKEIPQQHWIVRPRHLQLNELDQKGLSDARFVFVAGVANPQGKVDLLKQYVLQGGQLLIAAGGQFSPALWNQFGWNAGDGILPFPLTNEVTGSAATLDDGGAASYIDPLSMSRGSAIRLSGVSSQEWRDMLGEAVIFQYIQQKDSEADLEAVVRFSRERRQSRVDEIRSELAEMDRTSELSPDLLRKRSELVRELDRISPQWLNWRSSDIVKESAEASVLARLVGSENTLVSSRPLGSGRVVFIGTGIRPRWNLIARFPAILMWDQLMRDALRRTLPESDTIAQREYTMVLPPIYRNKSFSVLRPDGSTIEPKQGFVSRSEVGIQWDLDVPGVYEVRTAEDSSKAIVHRLSVNVDANEFELDSTKLPDVEVENLQSVAEASGGDSSMLVLFALLAIFLELIVRSPRSLPQGRSATSGQGR